MKIHPTNGGSSMITRNSSVFCARRLKALADPSRWAIITSLMNSPKMVAELQTELQIEQTLLSHHLKILRAEGFVESVREGKNVRCRLADNVLISGEHPGIDLGCCRLELN
jgi:ArsR family transcriptional regulator